MPITIEPMELHTLRLRWGEKFDSFGVSYITLERFILEGDECDFCREVWERMARDED